MVSILEEHGRPGCTIDTALQRLERIAGKLARSVLRRGSRSNAALLSDTLSDNLFRREIFVFEKFSV